MTHEQLETVKLLIDDCSDLTLKEKANNIFELLPPQSSGDFKNCTWYQVERIGYRGYFYYQKDKDIESQVGITFKHINDKAAISSFVFPLNVKRFVQKKSNIMPVTTREQKNTLNIKILQCYLPTLKCNTVAEIFDRYEVHYNDGIVYKITNQFYVFYLHKIINDCANRYS